VIFFYELLFVLVAVGAVVIGEAWSRSAAVLFLIVWFVLVWIGAASFELRLAASPGLADDERRWYADARDGLRHLRLLFGVATVAALVWRLIAG
jgi:hypothetical protein